MRVTGLLPRRRDFDGVVFVALDKFDRDAICSHRVADIQDRIENAGRGAPCAEATRQPATRWWHQSLRTFAMTDSCVDDVDQNARSISGVGTIKTCGASRLDGDNFRRRDFDHRRLDTRRAIVNRVQHDRRFGEARVILAIKRLGGQPADYPSKPTAERARRTILTRHHVETTEWSDWYGQVDLPPVVPVVFQIGQFEHVARLVNPVAPIISWRDVEICTRECIVHDRPLARGYRRCEVEIFERLRTFVENFLIFRRQEVDRANASEVDERISGCDRGIRQLVSGA